MRAGGFTLIETLVALVVATTAATVIFASVRALLQRAEQEQRQLSSAVSTLNASVLYATFAPYPNPLLTPNVEHVEVQPTDSQLPAMRVRNFSVLGDKVLPPVSVAYTPFQAYTTTTDERFAITMIAGSLPHEGNKAVRPEAKARASDTSNKGQ